MKSNYFIYLLLSSLIFTNALCMEEDTNDIEQTDLQEQLTNILSDEESKGDNYEKQSSLLNFKTAYKNSRSLTSICLALVAEMVNGDETSELLVPLINDLKQRIPSAKQVNDYLELIKFENWTVKEMQLAYQLWENRKTTDLIAMGALYEFDQMRDKENPETNCQTLNLLLTNEAELKSNSEELQWVIYYCTSPRFINIVKFIYAIYPTLFTESAPTIHCFFKHINSMSFFEVLLVMHPYWLELVKFCLEIIIKDDLSINTNILLLAIASVEDSNYCHELLKLAIARNIDLNTICQFDIHPYSNYTSLMISVERSNSRAIKLLLDHNANIFVYTGIFTKTVLKKIFSNMNNLCYLLNLSTDSVNLNNESISKPEFIKTVFSSLKIAVIVKKHMQKLLQRDQNSNDLSTQLKKLESYIHKLEASTQILKEKFKINE